VLLTNICKGSPHTPGDDTPPSKDRPLDAGTPYCPSARYRNDPVTYEFPIGADISVLQTTHRDENSHRTVNVNTVGEIRLRRLPKDSKHGNQAYFTVNVHVSDRGLEVIRTWDEDSRLLKVSTPVNANIDTPGPHCVSLEITAWFPEDAELTNLLIESITLTLRVLDDIKINVIGRSKFATITGKVSFPAISLMAPNIEPSGFSGSSEVSSPSHPFSSRRILVETVSGSIDGTYPLMDYLGISSQSGSIHVGVLPQVVLPSAPAPADLEVQTASGGIQVHFPVRDVQNPTYTPPPRNYITRVHSSSGSIKGSFYLGSVSNIRSTSGSVHIKGLPVIQEDAGQNTFETHTVNGGTHIQVLDPIYISLLSYSDEHPIQGPHPDPFAPIGDDDPYLIIPPNQYFDQSLFEIDEREEAAKKALRNLRSVHVSSSGSVDVQYPNSWEGTLHAKSVSGSVSAKGDGIRIIRERKWYGYKEVLARKGVDDDNEGSIVDMTNVAGSLQFTVAAPV